MKKICVCVVLIVIAVLLFVLTADQIETGKTVGEVFGTEDTLATDTLKVDTLEVSVTVADEPPLTSITPAKPEEKSDGSSE